MKITTTAILVVFCFIPIFAQNLNNLPWHDRTHLTHGIYFGSAPIYRDSFPQLYIFAEGQTNLNIKNLPFDFNYRLSNEKYYYGQANYFRFSYNAARYRGKLKLDQLDSISKFKTELDQQNQQLHAYESKLAYYYQHIKGLKLNTNLTLDSIVPTKYALPNLPNGKVPDIESMDTSIITGKIEVPSLPSLDDNPLDEKLDANLKQVPLPDSHLPDPKTQLEDSIEAIKSRIEKLQQIIQVAEQQFKRLNQWKGTNFLSNIQTLEVGLTGLNADESGTTIPIQGVNFSYQGTHYFVDFAAGSTLPNQIITTDIFQQMAYNNANPFSSGFGSLFNIRSTKILARTNVGYGDKEKNYVSLETFYNSRTFKWDKEDSLYNVSMKDQLTTNVTGQLTLLKKKNLLLSGSTGITWLDKNNQNYHIQDHLGGNINAIYLFKKQKITASYRYLSANYDSWVQGIFLAQNERLEIRHQVKINKNWAVDYRYARNRYFTNQLFGGSSSNEYAVNSSYYRRNFGFSFHYSLLQLIDRQEAKILNNKLNHLGGMNLYWSKNFKHKGRYVFNLSNNSLFMENRDTLYQIYTTSMSNRVEFKKFYVGLTLRHQFYQGLEQLKGNYFIVQPEVGITIKSFYFRGALSASKSQLFNWSFGGKGEVGFRFDRHLSWAIEFQRYLKTEVLLFRNFPENTQPQIIKLKMIIDI